jgi:hypothetical protein
MVIFGAAGDLAWRKLLLALYNLNVDGLLPANSAAVGFGLGGTRGPGRMDTGPGLRRHPGHSYVDLRQRNKPRIRSWALPLKALPVFDFPASGSPSR